MQDFFDIIALDDNDDGRNHFISKFKEACAALFGTPKNLFKLETGSQDREVSIAFPPVDRQTFSSTSLTFRVAMTSWRLHEKANSDDYARNQGNISFQH